ncbi:hypothetical protein ACEU6E_06720 [Halorutilales archaeon Cl-col2-1]
MKLTEEFTQRLGLYVGLITLITGLILLFVEEVGISILGLAFGILYGYLIILLYGYFDFHKSRTRRVIEFLLMIFSAFIPSQMVNHSVSMGVSFIVGVGVAGILSKLSLENVS